MSPFTPTMNKLIDLKLYLEESSPEIKEKLLRVFQRLDVLNEKFFNNTADMLKIVENVINTIVLELSVNKQKIRHADQKKIMEQWKKSLEALLYTMSMFEQGGVDVRSFFTDSQGIYMAFSQTEDALNKLDKGNLHALISKCTTVLQDIPEDRGGKMKTGSPLQRTLIDLASEWVKLTGKKPTCGWSECQNTHVGSFYEFVATLIPITLKICQLMQVKITQTLALSKKTIGQWITEII